MFAHTAKPPIMHRAIVLAGLAGALAEVIWVALYSVFMPLSGNEVLRQITASIFPGMTASAWAPTLGLAIHFALGVLVAYAFGLLVWQSFAKRLGMGPTLATALLVLVAIWTFNFFVLLPVVNAKFIGLMPYAVTFASKALFGVAMGTVLNLFAIETSAEVDVTPLATGPRSLVHD